MNKINKKIIWLILFLISINLVHSLGIAPSSVEQLFQPNTEKQVQIKIFNTNNEEMDVIVYAEGPLAEYITITESLISFSKSDDAKMASYTIAMPEKMEKQGIITTDIIIRQVPKKNSQSGTSIQASLAMVSQLRLTVPFSGKYAEARLFIADFKQDQESSFAVEIKNHGTEDILSAKIMIDIIGPLNNKLAMVLSDETSVPSKETRIVSVKWVPKLGAGNYKAVATIIYDGKTIMDEKAFTVGEPTVSIKSISVNDFKLGGIAKFEMIAQSNWNLVIENVFAQVDVKDETGKLYTQYKTATVYLEPFGSQSFDSYWDTSKVSPGKYKLDITMFYLGKSTINSFDIFVSTNEIKTTPVGQVISAQTKEQSTVIRAIYLLAILIIILIVFNVYIYYKKLRKK